VSAYAPHKYNPWEMPEEELEATFIGRQALLNRLLEAVREQGQAASIQHYVLLGPRGIGKTTLLLLLRRRLKKDAEMAARWLCVHYREEEFYVYTLRDLLALALESLYADEGIAEAKPILDEAQAETDDEKSQAILLAGLRRISEARGQRFLLLVDNLDQFLRGLPKRDETETFQHALRKLLSTEHFLMVIGTSTRHFEEFASYDEAFFNFFCPITVGNLSDDEVDALLLARAGFDDNREFIQDYEQHKANVRTITFLTGGNPRLVLMLYEILSQHRILPVVHALRQIVDNLTPLFKDVLEQMSRQQSKVLDAIMRLGGAGSPTDIASTARLALNVVTTMLGRLRDAGFLASEGEGKGRPATYRVRDQMFRTWYQMRYLRPNRRRLELLSELLRAWFSASELEGALDRLHSELQEELADGLLRRAVETALTMEYYASGLEDGDARRRQMMRVAENYLRAGDLHKAALTMAEASGTVAESDAQYERGGLIALADRQWGEGNFREAAKAIDEVLRREPKNVVALLGSGFCHVQSGDHGASERAFTGALELLSAGDPRREVVLLMRGVAKAMGGNTAGALADAADIPALAKLHPINRGILGLATGFAVLPQAEGLMGWVCRIDDLETVGLPVGERLFVRTELLRELAKTISLDAAGKALDTMMETQDAALRERLVFLVPALELARTGDEGVLAKLPEAEREAARRMAADILKAREGKEG